MIKSQICCLVMLLAAGPLSAQETFEIPSEGFMGYRDLAPMRVATLLPDGESPDLVLLFGPDANQVLVLPELIADENGRIGGIVSLSWFDENDTPRLLELPASGRMLMRTKIDSSLTIINTSMFQHEWDHQLDIRAVAPSGELQIVGTASGTSKMDPTLSRRWTLDLTARVDELGEASARTRVVFGNEAIARFGTSEGRFGAEDTRLREWSGDAILFTPSGAAYPGGSMFMETHYFNPDGDILGTFFLRAHRGHVRTVVSGWLPVTYDETALAVGNGTFDFATLGLLPTNQLFATPAFTVHEQSTWDDDFWDRGQVNFPLLDR